MGASGYILPCAQNNPTVESLYGHEVAYVFWKNGRSRPTRVVQSGGDMGDAWDIDTQHQLFHDQDGTNLGVYKVVGIAYYDEDGQFQYGVGDVLDRKMATAVFK